MKKKNEKIIPRLHFHHVSRLMIVLTLLWTIVYNILHCANENWVVALWHSFCSLMCWEGVWFCFSSVTWMFSSLLYVCNMQSHSPLCQCLSGSNHLVHTQHFSRNHLCAYQGLWNVGFSESFAYILNIWFLLHITDLIRNSPEAS